MIRLAIVFVLIAYSFIATGQFYSTGQTPYSIQWLELQTKQGKVVFPLGADSLALLYSKYLNHSMGMVSMSLNHKPKKIPTIIHAHSVLSNGMVAWAPKRVEIISAPSLSASPETRFLTLAIHENRHVVQLDKLNDGFIKWGSYLFGQQTVGFAAAIVPLWFFEGDAVYAETIYSKSGRGRQASFYQHYRTHLLNNGGSTFSYDKWLLGSYKDFIPNHYSFGYQMVGYSNLKHGSRVWANALKRTARMPYIIFPFNYSHKKDTGLSLKKLYKQAFQHLDSTWITNSLTDSIVDYSNLVNQKNNKTYTDYNFPFLLNDTTLVALKISLKRTPLIIQINIKTGDEKTLVKPGYINQRISYSANGIFWSQYKADPRWEQVSYSEIWNYDFTTSKATRLTTNSRYFNPIALKNGAIATIESTPYGDNFIAILDGKGVKLNSIRIVPSLEPKELFENEDNHLFARCSSPKGTVIIRYKEHSNPHDTVLGPIYRDISNVSSHNGKLLFTLTHNFKEEAFVMDMNSKEFYRVSYSRYGLSNTFYVSENHYIASLYSSNGSFPSLIRFDTLNPIVIDPSSEPLYMCKDYYHHQNIVLLDTLEDIHITPRVYSNFKNLLRIHSWAPIYYNPVDLAAGYPDVYPGASVMSQNLTNTLQASLGYSYNYKHGYHAQIEWMGWYPKISVGVDVLSDQAQVYGGLTNNSENLNIPNSLSLFTRVRLPYRFLSGNTVAEINPGIRYSYSNDYLWNLDQNKYKKGLDRLDFFISFYALNRMAHRDIRPRLGAYLFASTTNSPTNGQMLGETAILRTGVYLPGLFSNQSLLISNQWEKLWIKRYFLSSRTVYPRGFLPINSEQMLTSNFDYTFPLAYPDLPIGPIIFVKRIFTNVFFDNAWIDGFRVSDQGNYVPQKYFFSSAGVEIYADVNLFRFPYLFKVGYRGGFTLDQNDYFQQFLISVNVSSLYGFLPNMNFLNLNL